MAKTNNQQQLAAIYSAADAFFNPTSEDNYPTANLEAEACGTPVVTYDTGGSRETVHLRESVFCDSYRQSCVAIEWFCSQLQEVSGGNQ